MLLAMAEPRLGLADNLARVFLDRRDPRRVYQIKPQSAAVAVLLRKARRIGGVLLRCMTNRPGPALLIKVNPTLFEVANGWRFSER